MAVTMDLLAQMAMFARVVETGSLSAAARAERCSLAAISKNLRALEKDLGALLIARSTRRLSVTDAGRRWYEHCLRVLRDVDVAREDVGASQSVRGTLVVSAAITLGNTLVVPKLEALTKRHPRLSVELRLEDRLVDLSGDAVDVAVRGGVEPPDSARVVAHRLLSFRRVVVASPSYLSKHGTPRAPEDLSLHLCLIQLREGRIWPTWHLVRDGVEQRVPVRGAIRTNAPLAIRDLARDGAGVALLPEWLVERDLEQRRLRRIVSGWSTEPVIVWAIYRTELRGSPRVRAFVDAMRGVGDRSLGFPP